jgi:hypothetical protein
VSKRDRLGLTPDLTTRDLWRSRRWARGNDNFTYSSLWDFKSSFTCRKILRHGTFPLYFPSERKVCCGFLSSIKIHRLGWVLNPQPLGPMASLIYLLIKQFFFYNLSFIIVYLSLESRFSFVPFVLYILTYMFILLDCYIPVLVTCVGIGTIHVDVLAINSQKSDR